MFYKITFDTIPSICYAHGYVTEHYAMDFREISQVLQITYIEQGECVKEFSNGRVLHVPEQHILFTDHREGFRMFSRAPLHRHFTVGLKNYSAAEPVSDADIVANDFSFSFLFAIVPEVLPVSPTIEKTLKKLIRAYSGNDPEKGIAAIGLLFTLLGQLTEESSRMALVQKNNVSFSAIFYVERAQRYILEHLSEKISVSEIARSLGISNGYLYKLFKEITDQSVNDYITAAKLNRVKELLTTQNATLKEAGISVGIADENYLSRIFKKHTGITVREYRVLHAQ